VALRELFARFAFEWDGAALRKVTSATQAAEAKVVALAGGLNRTSATATRARGPLGAWAALARENGASAMQFGAAVRGLRANVAAAAGGDKKLAAAFQELGVDIARASAAGRSSESVWTEVTGRLAAVEKRAKQTRLAMTLLGDAGAGIVLPQVTGGAAPLRAKLHAEQAPRAPVPAVVPAPNLTRVQAATTRARELLDKLGVRWRQVWAGGNARKAAADVERVTVATEHATAKAHGLHGAMREALAAFGVFGGIFGAVFAGHALVRTVEHELEAADATAKLAKQLGVTAEGMQQLAAFAKLGGNSIDDLRVGVTTMTRNLGLMAATGEGRAKRVLKEMGVAADDLKGKKPDALFWEFGKAIASIEDPTRRSAFAQRIFGESGSRMLSMFHGTAEEIDKQKKLVEELGVVWSEDFARATEEVNDQLHLAGLQMQRVKVNLIGLLLPALRWGSERAIHFGHALSEAAERTNIFKGLFASGGWMVAAKLFQRLAGGVGGLRGMLSKIFPLLARIGRVLLPWIAWALIIDDITMFLQGGDSALGRFLDTLFGAGAAKATLEGIRAGWAAIVEWIRTTVTAFREWWTSTSAGAEAVKDTLRGMFAIVGGVLQLIAMAAGDTSDKTIAAFLRVTEPIGAAVSAVGEFFSLLWNDIVTGASNAIDSAVEYIVALPGRVGGKIWKLLTGEGPAPAGAPTTARPIPARPGMPAPALPPGNGTGTRSVALTDQRQVTVHVQATDKPAVVGRKVASAVVAAQPPNMRALQSALAGAPRG
jgi:hypothetical protein